MANRCANDLRGPKHTPGRCEGDIEINTDPDMSLNTTVDAVVIHCDE